MRYIYQHNTHLFISSDSNKNAIESKTEFNKLIKNFENDQRKQIINNTKILLSDVSLTKYINYPKTNLSNKLIEDLTNYITKNNITTPHLPNGLVNLLIRQYLLDHLLLNKTDFQISLHNYFTNSNLSVKELLINLENIIHNIDKDYIITNYVPENYFHLDYLGQQIEFNQDLMDHEIKYIETHSKWKCLKDTDLII